MRYHDQPVQLAIAMPGALTWGFLALRRRRPLLTVAVMAGMGALGSLLQAWLVPGQSTNSDVAIIALLVAGYSLGAYGSRRELLLGAPLPILVILLTDVLQPVDEPLARAVPFAVAFVVLAPVAAGRLVRARALAVERLRAQAAELAAHRAEQVAADVARDRLRLSERFHAQLLDGMHLLVGEVEQARRIVAVDPRDRATEGADEALAGQSVGAGGAEVSAMTAIEQAARRLLAETRQVVVSLTGGAGDPDRSGPEPSPVAGVAADRGRDHGHRRRSGPLSLAVLGCALLVVPLALVWLSPLSMTALLWMFAALFDRFVASLAPSTAAIGLVVAAPFAVAALTSRPRAVAGLAVCVVGELVVFAEGNVGAALVISALGWLAGAVLRERTRLVEDLRRNADQLARQRAAVGQRAVLQERARLARDLHDTAGHSLTVVALKAGAARRLWPTDRERAAQALETIAAVLAGGLAELRTGWEPIQPIQTVSASLGSLEPLLDGARAAGLPLATDPAALGAILARLDPEVAWTAYRVLQESLTNVLRHAPGAETTVAARVADGFVELEVDNAPGGRDAGVGSGRGLAGMRTRVTTGGGRLDWGARPDGGFAVRARLPLAGAGVREVWGVAAAAEVRSGADIGGGWAVGDRSGSGVDASCGAPVVA